MKKKFQATQTPLLALDQLQDWFDSDLCMKQQRSGPCFIVGPFLLSQVQCPLLWLLGKALASPLLMGALCAVVCPREAAISAVQHGHSSLPMVGFHLLDHQKGCIVF